MDVLETLTQFADRIAQSKGLELVDVEIFRAGRRRVVRVFIGKREGVSVDDCAGMSRDLSALLDAEGFLENDAYMLEVSSPGLDRPFKTLRDYRRNLGREVRVTTKEPIAGKSLHVGTLEEAGEDAIVISVKGKNIPIPMSLIAQAKVDVRIG